jgi:NAD(P)-dependent dehydrogenase (short-subunit alcohol dehydrogenase family)
MTAIVTGASRGIGAGVTSAFIGLGYNVVANALHFADSLLSPDRNLALEGNIGQASTALTVAETAISRFGSIDAVVANAGIFFTKPFTDYTPEDFRRLSDTNLEGYLYITQFAVKQMLTQKRGGSVICMTSAMVRHPLAGVRASVAMMTKGGLEAITLSLAMEYAKDRIRF